MANKRKKNKHTGPVHVRALPLGWQIRVEVPGGPNLNVNADKLEDAVIAAIGGVIDDPTGRLQKLIRRLVVEAK